MVKRSSPRELRRAHRLAGLLEEAVVRRHDHQLAVGRLEHLVRDDQRERGAVPPGRRAAREDVDELVGDERERRLVEREVERPPLALVQRRDDRERRPDAGADVDQRDADPHRVPVGLAGDAHDPRRRLHQRVVARLGGERPVAPEGADRRVDEPRVARPERLRPEAEPLGRAGAQALHRHVRAVGEPQQRLEPLRRLQVERERALARVRGEEHDAAALEEPRAPVARLVAAAGMLDLDDVGAQRAEDLGGGRPGERARQVEHADAGEGAEGHRLHHRDTALCEDAGSVQFDRRRRLRIELELSDRLRGRDDRRVLPDRAERGDRDRGRRRRRCGRPQRRALHPRRRRSGRSPGTTSASRSATSSASASSGGSSRARSRRNACNGRNGRSNSAAAC